MLRYLLITSLLCISLVSAKETGGGDLNPVIYLDSLLIDSWQDMRFGLSIQWGPVSIKGKEIGWSRGNEIPKQEYDSLYKQFNPTKFNASEILFIRT